MVSTVVVLVVAVFLTADGDEILALYFSTWSSLTPTGKVWGLRVPSSKMNRVASWLISDMCMWGHIFFYNAWLEFCFFLDYPIPSPLAKESKHLLGLFFFFHLLAFLGCWLL